MLTTIGISLHATTRLIFLHTPVGAGYIKTKWGVDNEGIIHIHSHAGMHLRDQRQACMHCFRQGNAVRHHGLWIVAGFATEVQIAVITGAQPSQPRGVNHRDTGS